MSGQGKAAPSTSREWSIFVAVNCSAALAVLNPFVISLFLSPLTTHNIVPFLLFLDAVLGSIVVAAICHVGTRIRGFFITALCMLFLLPVLMVVAEFVITYYHLTHDKSDRHQWVQLDPELGWRLIADTNAREVSEGNYAVFYRIDEKGRKAIPQSELAKGAIHFFGESFIFGQGVNNKDTAANLLAEKLRPHYNVLNHGVPGYGLEQMFLALRSRLEDIQSGDVVVFAPLSGDLKRNFIHRAHFCQYVFRGRKRPSLPKRENDAWAFVPVTDECGLLEALALNSFGPLGRLYQWWHEKEVADEILLNADQIFSQAAELTKMRDAGFVVVFLANPAECKRRRFEVDIDELRTPFASLLPYCPSDETLLRRLHFPSDYHWAAEGNRWAADALERIITQFIGRAALGYAPASVESGHFGNKSNAPRPSVRLPK